MAANTAQSCTDGLYTYKAEIINVYDGDTVTANIDLGFNVSLRKVKLRLLRINAPELRGSEKEEGIKSRDYLKSLILNKKVIIKSKFKSHDSFGRILANIYLPDSCLDINAELVNKGFASFKDY